MVKLAVKYSLTAGRSLLIQCFNNYLQNKISKQLKVNHKHSYHVIENNSQAKIEDKQQKIRIKSMNYDALIYHENIYDTLIKHKNTNIKPFCSHTFCIPHLCMHLSYACFRRWHDGSIRGIRGGLLYFVVLIKKKIFDFLMARAQQ